MSKINALALFVVIVACAACGAPAAMAETSEFTNVGSQLKETGGETVFTATGPPVTCTGSKGSGGVASSTQLKLEVAYEGCTLSVGKESFKGKVTTCHFGYAVEDAVKVESGCVVDVSECSLTPSNKQLKAVLYNSVEDKAGKVVEREMEVYMGLRHVAYKVTGSSCVLLGIKGSEEGTITDPAEMQVVGARSNPLRQIKVEGAASEAIETELVGTPNQTFTFPGETESITCTSMVWKGSTNSELDNLRFLKSLTATCTSNIYLKGGNEVPAILTFEKCELGIFIANGQLVPAQSGIAGLRGAGGVGCVFTAKITGTAICEISFAGPGKLAVWGDVGLHNEPSARSVGVVFPDVGEETAIPYSTNQNCPGVGMTGSATFTGSSKLRGWKTGAMRNEKTVEIV
jgi:hypothetical protein